MPATKISFEIDRSQSEIWEGLIAGLDPSAVVGQEAVSTANGDDLTSGETVRLVAFLSEEFDAVALEQTFDLGRQITAQDVLPLVEILPDEDWAAKSQEGLERLQVGRLLVHSPEDHRPVTLGRIPIAIQAANAFGTGHHGTTFGCLRQVQRLSRRQQPRVRVGLKIADVGCGTALLAFAAAKLFKPNAAVLASDIDVRALPTARANAKRNRLVGKLKVFEAADISHGTYRNHPGFDLVFANILSGLLVDMAPRLSQVVKPGGRLMLAGLLNDHAVTVARSYQLLGYRLESRVKSGDWSILTLRRLRPVRARTMQRGDQRFHPLKGGNWMHW